MNITIRRLKNVEDPKKLDFHNTLAYTLDTLYKFLFECKKMQNIFAALNMGHFPH